MDKRTKICEYLKENHRGKDNAVHSRELEQRFSIDGRGLRRKINSLRQTGVPICSGDTGYYYADSADDLDDTIGRLNTLARQISSASLGLLRSSQSNVKSVTIEIKIEKEV